MRVGLFGKPGVFVDGTELPLSPQQLALIVVVYGHGDRGLQRRVAIRLLWGANATPRLRHRLRQVLVELRRRVQRPIIATSGDLLLPLSGIDNELTVLQRKLAAVGSLGDAATIVRQGFGIISTYRGADAFDDWRSAEEAQLQDDVRIQARTRWDLAQARGEWTAGIDAAEALWILDPQDDQAATNLIDTLLKHGQVERAEKLFEEYRASRPGQEEHALELIAAIQRARRFRDLGSVGLKSSGMESPLIGRYDALRRARQLFPLLEDESFGLVLIAGESGIGKTRMLGELGRDGSLRGMRCLEAQAVEIESAIPLSPLLDALSSVDLSAHVRGIGHPWDAVIHGLIPCASRPVPAVATSEVDEGILPRRLFEAFALLFESLAREQPTLLLLDDLQWADTTTVTALRFMQRRWRGGAFGIVTSLRSDLVRRNDPASRYLAQSDGNTIRVDLGALSEEEGRELVHQVSQGRIKPPQASQICALTGCHPLYLTEFAREYMAGRVAMTADGRAVSIPSSLTDMLEARLQQLSEGATKLGGILATASRPMNVSLAGHLAGLSLTDAADALEELSRARLTESTNSCVRLTHELVRSAIYRAMSDPLRAINHRILAERLAVEAVDSPGELAIHYARAGERAKAAKHAWTAATRSMQSGAMVEAAQFFELVAETEADAVRRASATAQAAQALHLARDIGRAAPLLGLAVSRLDAVGKHSEASRLEIRQVESLAAQGTTPLTQLRAQLGQVKMRARERQEWESLALALDAELHLLHRNGDVRAIQGVFQEMREVASQGSREATLLCQTGLAMGVLFGDPVEALTAARSAVALASEGRSYRLRALLRLLVVLLNRGMLETPEVRPLVQEARALAAKSGDVLLRFSIESNLAVAAMDSGNLEHAEVLMERASTLAGSAEMDLNRFISAINRAELELARNDFERAEAAYRDGAAYVGPGIPSYLIDLMRAGRGLCALQAGKLSKAAQRARELGPDPESWYFDPTTIVTLRARLLEIHRQRDRALQLLETTGADLQGRLVLAWFKIRAQYARLLLRAGKPLAFRIAEECREHAESLNLAHLARQFSLLAAYEGPTVQRGA